MGLFNVFKKKKSKELANLPKAPSLPELGDDLPDLPSLPSEKGKKAFSSDIDIPDIKVMRKKPVEIKRPIKKTNIKEIGVGKAIEIEPEKEKRVMTKLKKPMAFLSRAKKFEQESIAIEKEELEHLKVAKPVYVEANIFKQMLSDISIINTEMRQATTSLSKMHDLEKAKESKFTNFKSNIMSVQRKFIYIDKLLFKDK